MSLNTQFEVEIKKILLDERTRLERELSRFAKKSDTQVGEYNTQWEDYGDDEEDNAAEVAAYGDSLGLEQALEAELQEIIAALQRLEDGTYGICVSCGQPIDPNRLHVRPQSALCIACKEKEQS